MRWIPSFEGMTRWETSSLVKTPLLIALLSGCCLLQACGSVKKSLGIDRDPPDEFSVTPSIQPLDMPPDFFALPVPDPGAPRPQDVKALEEKRNQILGIKTQNQPASTGEQNLLQLAGAEPKNGEKPKEDIRRAIDEESRIEQAKDGASVLQKLGIKKKQPSGEAIDPYQESIELQKKGVPQNTVSTPQ